MMTSKQTKDVYLLEKSFTLDPRVDRNVHKYMLAIQYLSIRLRFGPIAQITR